MEKMKDGRLTKRLHRAYVGGSRRSLRPKRRRWRERVKEFVEQNGLFYRESERQVERDCVGVGVQRICRFQLLWLDSKVQ